MINGMHVSITVQGTDKGIINAEMARILKLLESDGYTKAGAQEIKRNGICILNNVLGRLDNAN